jgi:hypothetical protein
VEPGEIRVAVGGASDRLVLHGSFTLSGTERPAGADRILDTPVLISDPLSESVREPSASEVRASEAPASEPPASEPLVSAPQ